MRDLSEWRIWKGLAGDELISRWGNVRQSICREKNQMAEIIQGRRFLIQTELVGGARRAVEL